MKNLLSSRLSELNSGIVGSRVEDFGGDFETTRKERVARVQDAKKLLMGSGHNYERLATGVLEGNDFGSSELAQELAYGNVGQLAIDYGQDVAAMAEGLQRSMNRVESDRTNERTWEETAQDTGIGVAAGLTSGLSGVASFGAGILNDDAGAAISGWGQDAGEFLHSMQSPELNRARELAGTRGQLDREDLARDFEEDVANGKTMPGLRRFGSEMLRAGQDLWENPSLAGDMTAEGIGSFVASGGLTRIGATAAAKVFLKSKGMSRQAANRFLKSGPGRAMLQRFTVRGMPVGIGALEGGGAYAEVQNEIQNMSHEELMEGSEEYQALVESGASQEEARNQVANTTALQAGGMQAVVGGAAGKLVSKFESNPLGELSGSFTKRMSKLGENVLRETAEEGFQSGSAAVLTGEAIRQNVDPDRDPWEGVGTDVTKGMVAGAGMAGSIQAPGVVGAGVSQGTGAAVRAGVNARERQIDNRSSTGDRAMTEASGEITDSLQGAADTIEKSAATNPEDTGNVSALDTATKLRRAASISGQEAMNETPEKVRKLFLEDDVLEADQEVSRALVMTEVAKQFAKGELDKETSDQAALWLYEQGQEFLALKETDLSQVPEAARKEVQNTIRLSETLLSSPKLNKAVEAAQESTKSSAKLPEVTEQSISSPEVTQAINEQDRLARANPANVDPGFVEGVLNQRKAGKVNLTEIRARRMEAAARTARLSQKATQEKADALKKSGLRSDKGEGRTRETVRGQIMETGKNNAKGQWSLNKFMSEINSAMGRGNLSVAQDHLERLGKFGQSMTNKIKAGEQSAAMGRSSENAVSYDTFTGSAWIKSDSDLAGSFFVDPSSAESMLTADYARVDTNAIIETYNALLETFDGQLQGTPMTPVTPSFTAAEPDTRVTETDTTGSEQSETQAEGQETTNAVEERAEAEATSEQESVADEAGRSENEESVPQEEPAGEPEGSTESAEGSEAGQPDLASVETQETTDDGQEENSGTAEREGQENPGRYGETEKAGGRDDAGRSKENGEGAREVEQERPVDEQEGEQEAPLSFDHLVDERLHDALEFDTEKSELVGKESPLEHFIAKMDEFITAREENGQNSELEKNFRAFVATEAARLVDVLNEGLKRKRKGFAKPPMAMLEDRGTKNPLDLPNGVGMALAVVDETQGEYDQSLIETAAIAGVNWVMNQSRETKQDLEDIAKMFNVPEHKVTRQMIYLANRGMTRRVAKESLAQEVLEFWGAKGRKNAPQSEVRGISEGIAAELLTAMEGRLTSEEKVQLAPDRTPVSVMPRHESTKDEVKSYGRLKHILKTEFLPQSEQDVFIGDDIATGEIKRQKGNLLGQVSEQVKTVIQKHREIEFRPNMPMIGFMEAVGREWFLERLGRRQVDPENTHVHIVEKMKGKNIGLERGWDETFSHHERVLDEATKRGVSPEEIATRYEYDEVSNGRIMARGFSGQSDKTMRQAYAATNAVVDIETDVGDVAVWITVAQSIGVKTEKEYRADAVEQAKTQVIENFPETIQALRAWLNGEEITDVERAVMAKEFDAFGEYTARMMDALVTVARYENALSSVDQGDRVEFRLSLPLEADGKTDGPFNAMLHFLTGTFTMDQIEALRKGGFYPAELGQTLNQHFKNEKASSKKGDLYEWAANLFRENLQELRENLTGPERAQMDALRRFMDKFGEVKIKSDGTLEVGRGVLKNPLTITIYGSGKGGMSRKIASAMIEAFYEQRGEITGYPELVRDLETLMSQRIFETKRGFGFSKKIPLSDTIGPKPLDRDKMRNNPYTFEFSAEQMEMLSANVETLFVSEMTKAIDKVIGNVKQTTGLLEKATNIQSAVFIEHFQNAVRSEVLRQVEAGKLRKGGMISEEQYKAIFREMSKFGAVVESVSGTTLDASHINLSGSQSTPFEGAEFSRSLDGAYREESTLPQPGEASVRVTPGLTISRGDARMMVNYFLQNDPDLRVLQVYDGLEMPADAIDNIGEAINRASADAAMQNPLDDAYESYADFLKQSVSEENLGPLHGIKSVETFRKIWKTLDRELPREMKGRFNDAYETVEKRKGLKPLGKNANPNEIAERDKIVGDQVIADMMEETQSEIELIAVDLKRAQISTKARKMVFEEAGFSMDHMASAEAPHKRNGTRALPKSVREGGDEALLHWMQDRYEHHHEALLKEAQLEYKSSGDAKRSQAFRKAAEEVGTRIGNKTDGTDKGIISLSTTGLIRALEKVSDSKMSLSQKMVLKAMSQVLDMGYAYGGKRRNTSVPRFRVLMGSKRELTRWRNRNYPSRKGQAIEQGQIDLQNRIIYIASGSPETALHEMLHAATVSTIEQYYRNIQAMSPAQRTAVENLEKLMNQFMTLDLSGELNRGARTAGLKLQQEIRNAQNLTGDRKAEGQVSALAEFVAWTLTNQDLGKVLQRTKTRTKLSKIVDAALRGLRRMLGLPQETSLDMFSNIAWNTAATIRLAHGNREMDTSSMVLNQASTENVRLQSIMSRFEEKIGHHLRGLDPIFRGNEEIEIRFRADQAVNSLVAAGFNLTQEQITTFRTMQAAMASSMKFEPAAMVKIEKTFLEALSEMSDARIQAMLDGPMANNKVGLVATMIALSQVEPSFRRGLEGITVPENKSLANFEGNTLDEKLESFGSNLIDRLGTALSGGRVNPSMRDELDRLAGVMAEIERDNRTELEKQAQSLLSEGDARGSKMLDTAGQWLWEKSGLEQRKAGDTESQERVSALWQLAGIAGGVLSKEKSKTLAELTLQIGNENPQFTQPVTNLMREIIGITDSNRAVYKMVNEVKYKIGRLRQDFRKTIPRIIGDQFSRELKKQEWSALHQALGRTDIGLLLSQRGLADIRDILQNRSKRMKVIEAEKKTLKTHAGNLAPRMDRKAQELAEFMINRRVEDGNHTFLRNAYAISGLLGETGSEKARNNINRDQVEQAVDVLATLYAIEKLDETTLSWLTPLLNDEADGVDYVIHQLASLRQKEIDRANGNTMSRVNGFKGYIPSETREGAKLMVAQEKDDIKWQSLGYTKLRTYRGENQSAGRESYYFSTVSGTGAYQQGVMQTVHNSSMGVDPITGRALDGVTAGRLDDAAFASAKRLVKQNHPQMQTGEALMPLHDGDGQIIGYERSIDPEMAKTLNRNTHAGEMIGAWMGRQVEETMTDEFNTLLVDRLYENWTEGKKNRTKEYVDLMSQEKLDPVWADAWNMIPPQTKDYIREKFGKDGFMVRRDMVDNALGYRMPGISEAWDGPSRLPEPVKKGVRDAATLVLGADAFKYLVTAEEAWRTGISAAKNIIVIKSIVVPVSNIVSNVIQLLGEGVNMRDILRGFSTKLVEINQHLKNLDRMVELEADMARASDDPQRQRRIRAEQKALDESSRRMTIWPLIDAGEFSTISEGLTQADASIGEGRWADYMANLTEKIPAQLGTVGRYTAITQDTALFQGMSRAVQYGDFLAKAVLYDHLTSKKMQSVNQKQEVPLDDQGVVSVVKGIAKKRRSKALTTEMRSVSDDLISELGDVSTLLDLLEIDHKKYRVTKAPSEKDILSVQERMLEIYIEVKDDPGAFEKYRSELSNMMQWFTSKQTNTDNEARKRRAERHAAKYGKGNVKAHYLVQTIEELGEVLVERDRLAGVNNNENSNELEIQKRALKVLRFGGDTVNKGTGPYEGKTNNEALKQVMGNSLKVSTTQEMSSEDAMNLISEAFVNYNLLPGRARSYAESIGMTWFWAYKLRVLKQAHRLMRDRPLRALLTVTGTPMLPDVPGVSVGSPLTDNVATVIADDRAGYSLGWGMLWGAPSLHPWVNLVR